MVHSLDFLVSRYDGIDSDRYAAHDGAMAPFAARAPVDNKEIGIVARLLLWSGGKKRRIGREKTHTEEGPPGGVSGFHRSCTKDMHSSDHRPTSGDVTYQLGRAVAMVDAYCCQERAERRDSTSRVRRDPFCTFSLTHY